MQINNFKKKLICWGAGDQSIVLKPIIENLGAQYDILIDDTVNKKSPFEDVDIIGGKKEFENWFKGRNAAEYGFTIAIGNPYGFVRCKIHNYLVKMGLSPVTICDTSALLDKDIHLEEGVQILKGVIVNSKAKIGYQSILNTGCIVEHHTELSSGVEIGPRAVLCGRVVVEQFTWVGAGAVVLPRIIIGKNSIVGAGAVVTKNTPENQVFAGVPSKFIKFNKYTIEEKNG